VRTTAIINHGGARIGITLSGIDPRREIHVSKLAAQMREGKIDDLLRAPNGIIMGEALAEKLGVKTGNTVLLIGGQGVQLNSTVAGLYRSGLKRLDESQIYSLMGPAQVMMGQSGVVNQLRLRLSDPMEAQKVAAQVEAQTGYKSVSWQEANADLLSTFSVRDFIVLTVMGAMLLTSSFATYNIISTITHEKRADIAIMKSLGMRDEKYTPRLPLGSKGKLEDRPVEVIGFLVKQCKVDGIAYDWREYLLAAEHGGYRWLTEYNGHWNIADVLSNPPATSGIIEVDAVRYGGQAFKHFATTQAAEVIQVAG
jgi:hypothetical protein